jgi:hypothetical protein
MEAIFAEAYVPTNLRRMYLTRCSTLTAEDAPGPVWVLCLRELLGFAVEQPSITTEDLLKACNASADAMAEGFSPHKAQAGLRRASIAVAAKICAWHYERPELVLWLVQQLKKHAMLPQNRISVVVARQLCETTIKYQGIMRTAEESHHAGELLVRLVGLGTSGWQTTKMLWRDRSKHLVFALRYRAWSLLSGLADAGRSCLQVSLPFDADLWLCAAVERPSPVRRNILDRLLAHFRHVKIAAPHRLKCTQDKCLASTVVDAAFVHQFGHEPALIKALTLFVDVEHAVRGCPCSPHRETGFCISGLLPAWGGTGSSIIATVARHCRDLNNRRTAGGLVPYVPTADALAALMPVFVKAVQPKHERVARNVYDSMVAEHSRVAVAVLAASPFLDADEQAWRPRLLDTLKRRPEYWHRCLRNLALTADRVVSRHFAWLGPAPIQNLIEATAAAGGFATNDNTALRPHRKPEPFENHEMELLSGVVSLLGALAHHNVTPAEWMLDQLDTGKGSRIKLLEYALQHESTADWLLKGRYAGTWGKPAAHRTVALDAFTKAAVAGGPECLNLLHREAGLWTVKPADRHRGWWHLGGAFAKAALTFMAAATSRKCGVSIPSELCFIILDMAAAQATPLRIVQ